MLIPDKTLLPTILPTKPTSSVLPELAPPPTLLAQQTPLALLEPASTPPTPAPPPPPNLDNDHIEVGVPVGLFLHRLVQQHSLYGGPAH